jgi:hypothetical protein
MQTLSKSWSARRYRKFREYNGDGHIQPAEGNFDAGNLDYAVVPEQVRSVRR